MSYIIININKQTAQCMWPYDIPTGIPISIQYSQTTQQTDVTFNADCNCWPSKGFSAKDLWLSSTVISSATVMGNN